MGNLSREEVVAFLAKARPDMSEKDWKEADLITVLSWAIPYYNAWLENGLIKKPVNKPHGGRHLFECKSCSKQIWLTTDVFLKGYLSGECLDCKSIRGE